MELKPVPELLRATMRHTGSTVDPFRIGVTSKSGNIDLSPSIRRGMPVTIGLSIGGACRLIR